MTTQIKPDLYPLYKDLSSAFPHPLDWTVGMSVFKRRPPIWKWRSRAKFYELQEVFKRHGFTLTDDVLLRWGQNPESYRSYGLDAGGRMICDLAYALEDQTGWSWEEYL